MIYRLLGNLPNAHDLSKSEIILKFRQEHFTISRFKISSFIYWFACVFLLVLITGEHENHGVVRRLLVHENVNAIQ